jgi:hypothetical protein
MSVLSAVGLIDMTTYVNDDNHRSVRWRNDEVLQLLADIRAELNPAPLELVDGRLPAHITEEDVALISRIVIEELTATMRPMLDEVDILARFGSLSNDALQRIALSANLTIAERIAVGGVS